MERAGNDVTNIITTICMKEAKTQEQAYHFPAVSSNCNKHSLLQLGREDGINLSTIKSMQAGRGNYNNTYTVNIFTN